LGPFQRIDGETDFGRPHVVNGQGPAGAKPVVIAATAVPSLPRAPHPARTDPSMVYFEGFTSHVHFRDAPIPKGWEKGGVSEYEEYYRQESDTLDLMFYATDKGRTYVHGHDKHFMTGLYDGPTSPPAPQSGINYAAVVLLPRCRPVLRADNELSFSFEVDAKFGGRRWIEVALFDARDPLPSPNKTLDHVNPMHPTGPKGRP